MGLRNPGRFYVSPVPRVEGHQTKQVQSTRCSVDYRPHHIMRTKPGSAWICKLAFRASQLLLGERESSPTTRVRNRHGLL